MNNYVFFTPEGLTFKPNCDRPEPESVDMQMIGVGHDDMFQDALMGLLEVNHTVTGSGLDKILPFQDPIKSLNYFSFKDEKRRIMTAS
jgi:hypothetical protein